MHFPVLLKILAIITLLGVGSTAQAVTLKIATQAPDGTTWMKDMRAAAKEKPLMEEQFGNETVDSPLFKMFQCGASKDGHWNNDKMRIQCKDFTDCLKE